MLEIRKYLSLKHFILFPMIGAAFLTVDCATFAQGTTLYVLTENASRDRGYSYIVKQDFGTAPDTGLTPMISKLRIFENGVELQPAHSLLADIRHLGKGRFRHWGKGQLGISKLYFSTSDNTDPRTNGRVYTYQIDSELAPTPAPAPTPSTITGPVFYVAPTGSDSNPGTQAAPWRTITKAAKTLTAGQTAVVMDGTYVEGEISFRNSGTASQPITLMAQNKWQAILSSTSGCNPGISLYASYITIQDLHIAVDPSNQTCSSFTPANAGVRAWELNDPTPSSPSTGYQGFTARGLLVDAANVRDVGIKSNQDYALIENSTVHGGLEAANTLANVFRNNVVYDDASGQSAIGINAKSGVRNFQAYNNVVHITQTTSSGGIVLGGASCALCHFDPSTGWEAYNAVAYNNVVISDVSIAATLGIRSGSNCTFLNNVVIGGMLSLFASGPLNLNPSFINNIMTANGKTTTVTSGSAGWDGYWSGTLTVDHNDFYGYSSVPTQTNAIVGNPNFVNPASDWHLQPGSPALGSGIEVNIFGFNGIRIDVSRNKDGNIRTPPVNLGIY